MKKKGIEENMEKPYRNYFHCFPGKGKADKKHRKKIDGDSRIKILVWVEKTKICDKKKNTESQKKGRNFCFGKIWGFANKKDNKKDAGDKKAKTSKLFIGCSDLMACH